jgi:hypothetical protein
VVAIELVFQRLTDVIGMFTPLCLSFGPVFTASGRQGGTSFSTGCYARRLIVAAVGHSLLAVI